METTTQPSSYLEGCDMSTSQTCGEREKQLLEGGRMSSVAAILCTQECERISFTCSHGEGMMPWGK